MKATVNWMENWANPPKLEIHTDEVPENDAFIYEQRGTCYFAVDQETSQVRFFHYEKPGPGYGGHEFEIQMKDGSKKSLIGPWSSRCAIMNEVGFPHSVECVLITPTGHLSGAILIDKAKELLAASDENAEFVYEPENFSYEINRK